MKVISYLLMVISKIRNTIPLLFGVNWKMKLQSDQFLITNYTLQITPK